MMQHDYQCEYDGEDSTCYCIERANGDLPVSQDPIGGYPASERDPHAVALARIGELRSLLEAGTAGPWVAQEGIGGFWWIEQPNRSDIADLHADGRPAPDAALITAAVNHFGPFLDAMEATLQRHAPALTITGARYCLGGHDLATLWKKCPDARVVLTALGIEVTS